MPENPRVAGRCPMGCGETLFLAVYGHERGEVTCYWHECPNPSAADSILAESETEHVVRIGETGFSITHPLRERIDGALHECRLHEWLHDLDGPPAKPGMYRVVAQGDGWQFLQTCTVCGGSLESGDSGPECDPTGCPSRDGSDA